MIDFLLKPKRYFPQKEINIYIDKNNVIHAKYKDEDGDMKFTEVQLKENSESEFFTGVQVAIIQLINSPKIVSRYKKIVPKRFKLTEKV